MDWARILAYTTGTVDQDLLLRNDQTVGNVLRHHGIPPAPERKRRTTWAEFIQILSRYSQGRTFPRQRSLCED